ncbi:MAG: hypothetical protein L6264_12005 [Weeksellaceae bacterium]|nr:hypothetical protein [Bacteroidota bacterium]MCG2781662.1 hypothetical protein [Weeksellaceae bacterium]
MNNNLENRIADIETILSDTAKIFDRHNQLLQDISDKLNLHDEMFVKTMNSIVQNTQDSMANMEHITKIYKNISSLAEDSATLFDHISTIYKSL